MPGSPLVYLSAFFKDVIIVENPFSAKVQKYFLLFFMSSKNPSKKIGS